MSLFNDLSDSLETATRNIKSINQHNETVWFPDEKTGLQFDVLYGFDEDTINGIAIEAINFGESADLSEYFNDAALEKFELLILKKLPDGFKAAA